VFASAWVAVVIVWVRGRFPVPLASDFAQVWAAAGGWWAGVDPYAVVGPGRAFEWEFPLLYPMPAVLVGVPFAALPQHVAEGVFPALGVALYVLVTRPVAWWALASLMLPGVIVTSQWAPLLAATALMPWAAGFLACKPTIGGALFLAAPSRVGAVSIAAVLAVSVALEPSWPWTWLSILRAGSGHLVAPVRWWGGPLLLLALLRWRDWRARLLVLMALVPQNGAPYEAWTLFLIPRTHREGALLAGLSWLILLSNGSQIPTGQAMTWLCYLPCLAMLFQPEIAARIHQFRNRWSRRSPSA
jgi:hypothetical protein